MDALPQTHWIVIDVRTAQEGVNSGVSRFVVGLASALTRELSAQSASNVESPLKILLVARQHPPRWIVDLVRQFPQFVSFWSGGPGALTSRWNKPVYLWPTSVVKRIHQFTKGRFLWVAPANFDRPLFVSRSKSGLTKDRLIQVIHDTIPFTQKSGMGFFFRQQFCFLVRRTLGRFPHVLTNSAFSARELKQLSQKRTFGVEVLRFGIEGIFGSVPRLVGRDSCKQTRFNFLKSTLGLDDDPSDLAILNKWASMRWIVGVGRPQKYKNWDLALETVASSQTLDSEGLLLLRVGYDPKETLKFGKSDHKAYGRALFNGQLSVLGFSGLSDDSLAMLYSLSDVLLHPSRAEGFGFPPVEAALSGLPVIYRAGTAVETHFSSNVFPKMFWHGIDADDVDAWRDALKKVLAGDEESKQFFGGMALAKNPRTFIESVSRETWFRWSDSAKQFLEYIKTMSLTQEKTP